MSIKEITAEDFTWLADVINPALDETLVEFKTNAFPNEGGSRKRTVKRRANKNKTRSLKH
jgi:aspartokinase-like uncharacterized kinase